MKKFLGLILAGAMILSMSVFAFASSSSVPNNDWTGQEVADYYAQTIKGTSSDNPYFWDYFSTTFPDAYERYQVYLSSSCGDSIDPVAAAEAEAAAAEARLQEQFAYESGQNALAAEALGISMADQNAAADLNKSIGEYFNNSVNGVPGLANATPVAQGGNVIINGEPSNQTFSVYKPLMAHVDAAKAQAASLGGRVMNVVDIDASVYFDVATVNFYMPGVTGAENIQVYHFANGTWTPVNVAEVRTDHVVVDMTGLGIIAFIEVPAEVPAQ